MSEEDRQQPATPDLSIVVPAYKEAQRIGPTLEALRDYIAASAARCELIVVDDGSRDGTVDVVRRFAAEGLVLRLLVNPANRGKGYSVRQGMLAAAGKVLLMCDADLSAPISEAGKLLAWLERGYDVVVGSRDMPDSVLDPPQPLLRRLLAWGFRALRRRLLLPDLLDTQCGFKCFRREVARAVFSRAKVDGWLFDCEALGIADRLGSRIKEVGVVWRNHPDSRVRVWREALTALPRLLSIRRRLSRLKDLPAGGET